MAINPYFPNLFSEIVIGGVHYKNRITAAPLGNVSVRLDGSIPDAAFELYEKRARGGFAEVAASETPVDCVYANRVRIPVVNFKDYDSKHNQGLKKYTEMLHSYGAVATIELNHCGAERFASAGEENPIGPSAFVHENGLAVTEMDEALMELTAENFAQAAYYMKTAGYDGVIPHMASGWLLQQFFSPRTNRREDEYGGSLENRARFPLRVLRAIRERCGSNFLIIPRLCAAENLPGGYGIEDSTRLCQMMEGLVDAIHVVCGVYTDPVRSGEFSSMYAPHALNADYAATIRHSCRIPVILAGGINAPEQAEALLQEGKTDLVALGRQCLADPWWPRKAEEGRADDISRCIRCFRCFPGPLQDSGGLPLVPPDKKCTVNPLSDLTELDPPISQWPKSVTARNVLVVGGGVAGLTAAYTAAKRGHCVTLAEKAGRPGGLVNVTDADSYKADMKNFKELCIRRCQKAGVRVMTNTNILPENVRNYAADAVILAVGSVPTVPEIPGIETALSALSAYEDPTLVGSNVVIVGGGMVGCEVALHLAQLGRRVTLITRGGDLAANAYKMHRIALLDMLRPTVKVRTGLRCVSFETRGIHCINEADEPVFIDADTVVFAMGMRANSALADSLEAALGDTAKVYRVGDCVRAGKVQNAVEDGFLAAMKIV